MNIQNELSNQIEFITKDGIQLMGLSNINTSLSIHYLIYKIYNIENGKYYIGQHQTSNPYDSYMGSGLYLQNALNYYSLSSFIKEILYDFSSFELMDNKEAELVQLSNCAEYDNMSYNLKTGGRHYQFTESTKQKIGKSNAEAWNNHSEEWKNNYSNAKKLAWEQKTDEEKQSFSKILKDAWQAMPDDKRNEFKHTCSIRASGENNPMYGDYEHTKGLRRHSQNRIGKTIDEIFGYEKACEMRQKYSNNTKGENNPMYGKNPLAGKTKDEIKKIKDKERITKQNKSEDEKLKTKQKISEASKRMWQNNDIRTKIIYTITNYSPEKKQQIAQKQRDAWNNKSNEEKKYIKDKISKSVSGENNPMYGEKLKDHMSKEAYDLMKLHQKQSIANRSPEKKRKISEHQAKQILGRKQMYHPSNPQHKIRVKTNLWKLYLDQGYIFSDINFHPKL